MRFLFLILVFISVDTFSQPIQEGNAISWGINYLPGKVLIHTPRVYVLPATTPQAIELSYKMQTTGNREWHQKFGFPEVALNVAYSQYHFSYFGNAIGFYPSIQFKVINFNWGNWFFKMGGGLGSASKHWDKSASLDSFNNFIGSTVNNFTMFQSGIHFSLANKWSAQIGMHYYHVSNAATRQPNFGINAFGFFGGVNYHPKGVVKKIEKKDWPKHKNPLNLNLHTSMALVEGKAFDGPLYRVHTYSAAAIKMYRNKNRVALGLNAVFNTRTLAIIKNNFVYENNIKRHVWQYSAFISNEFLFGKIGFPLELGFYLNNPVSHNVMYQKLGLLYHFYHNDQNRIKDSHLSLILNTHVSRAQYAELGFGFLF